ncbi:MAG: TonB-dependent receptor, partial [Ferruginibacter sp.]|nr:TonB-dependent receptor [Ferruginibacter sp.]
VQEAGNQQIMDASTISLLKASDSSLVKTSITDKKGNFLFEGLKEGLYVVVANSMGYSQACSKPVIVNDVNPVATPEVLQLIPLNKQLLEVVVTAKKQFIERRIDKTIINPDALISNTGSTAMEVLEKAPGVSVDKDGNISLKGKQGVIVMLDGKPSNMSGSDLANFLNSMPASNVDLIEIMLNPTAKYDASGNSGVINIRTKKNKQKGLNGSLTTAYGQGIYSKTNNSFNLNYKTGRVNLFSTVSINYRKNFQQLDIFRRYTNDDHTLKANFSQNTSKTRENYNYNSKVGMDFYATKKTSFGVVLSGYYIPTTETGNSYSYPRNSADVLDSIVTAFRSEKGVWKNGAVNLNFQHNFDSTGRQLTADVDFLQYRSDRTQQFDNIIYNANWSKRYNDALVGDLPSNIKIYAAKTDYAQLLKKGIKMEAGLKFSYVTTDNNANYFNVINEVKSVDIKKTNRFQYKENINAAYMNFSKTIKKWGLQAGLRVENTHYNGHQFGNEFRTDLDSTFKKSYTGAFPTAYISYNASDKNQYGFSFGRRIERPDYEDLNPFLFFLDKYTYEEGNPFLRPMYSNVFEVSHTYRQFLTTTLNYSHTKDLFNEVFRQNNLPDDSISTVVTKGNYGRVNNLSMSANAQIKVTKWWTSMIYVEGRYQEFKGILNGKKLEVSGTNFTTNVNNQFSFKKGWSAEISGFYRSKSVEGQIIIKSLSQADIGVKKEILKNKGALKLSIRDIYGPRTARGKIDFQNTEASFQQYNDSRVATLSFSYRFGNPVKGQPKRKTGGAGDEQNRIKSGN